MSFLKNAWYVAGHSAELDNEAELRNGLLARTICNEALVMFRTSDGTVAVLEDRCPHRYVPLSMGKRIGDTVQCGYHGLAFGATGACMAAPNEIGEQNRIKVRSYTVVEKYSLVWLWMGEADLANADDIPDFSFLADTTQYTISRGLSHIKANYQILTDNLLDLSHIHFLHPAVHVGSKFENFTNKLQIDGETVRSMLWRHHYHLSPQMQQLSGIDSDDAEGQGHSRWNAPGNLMVDTAYWAHGKGIDEAVRTPNAHLLTPETEFSTHYFWASARNFMLDNEAVTRSTEVMMRNVFETEDGPMCEAQQAAMGDTDDFLATHPIILKADAAGVAARRMINKLKRAEAESQVAVAAE